MSIQKSIIESVELDSGTEVYVQCSNLIRKDISLSIDGESSYGIRLSLAEARSVAKMINKVLDDIEGEQ